MDASLRLPGQGLELAADAYGPDDGPPVLLFPGGSYTFDPRTERLVQLFPFRFWFETSLALGALILLVCGTVSLATRPRGTPAGVSDRPVAWPIGGGGR